MKITKNSQKLNESVLLENEDAVVVTKTDSGESILDKVESEAEDNGLTNSAEVASEIVAAADKIEAEKTIVDLSAEDTSLGVKNKITAALDQALAASQRFKKRGIKETANIMICGLPGSGKTASVYDWASTARGSDGNKVHIEYLNMKNNDLDAYINGYTVQNKDNWNEVGQAFSGNLNGLDAPNSILFLDEYNRQTEDQIRASVLTLINEHYIVGSGEGRRRYFPNFLFTIAVMNPSVRSDRGAARLNDAEKTRFLFYFENQDSDPNMTIEFLDKQYNKLIKAELAKAEPDYDEIEDCLRIQDLGKYILSDGTFSYDGEDKLAILDRTGKKMLNQRSLTAALALTNGDVEALKSYIKDGGANFLKKENQDDTDTTTEMLLAILADYIAPSRDELFKDAGIQMQADTSDANTDTNDAANSPNAQSVQNSQNTDTGNTDADNNVDGGIEDDDDPDFWNGTTAVGASQAKTPSEAKQAILNVIKNWNL